MSAKETQQQHFRVFLIGALLMIAGLCTLMLLEIYQPDSIKREWLSLASIVVAIVGGVIALKGYLSLALIRFKHFIDSK